MRRYVVVLTPESEGGYSVVVPSLPGCFTEGDTVEEALAMARDAIAAFLDGESADEWPEPKGVVVAEVDVPVGNRDGALETRRLTSAAD